MSKASAKTKPAPGKRWFERWTAYIAGLTALGLAIIGFLTMGENLTEKGRELLYGVGLGSSPYERAAQESIQVLNTFTLPLVTSPRCSQLAGDGIRLRGLIPTTGEIRAAESRLNKTSDDKERALVQGTLLTVFSIRNDVRHWKEEVDKEGCIRKP